MWISRCCQGLLHPETDQTLSLTTPCSAFISIPLEVCRLKLVASCLPSWALTCMDTVPSDTHLATPSEGLHDYREVSGRANPLTTRSTDTHPPCYKREDASAYVLAREVQTRVPRFSGFQSGYRGLALGTRDYRPSALNGATFPGTGYLCKPFLFCQCSISTNLRRLVLRVLVLPPRAALSGGGSKPVPASLRGY
jgi:hypothetical protein